MHRGGGQKGPGKSAMDIIRILDQELINQIAAGEVIERPASVVKELLENAVDAGAQSIHIEVEGSGLDLIRLADDGSGMSGRELELAVLRHATSKIEHARELFSIRTLGFRGEALPSILSVSRSRVSSRATSEDVGWTLSLVAGEVRERVGKGMAQGTVVEVRDLFFNTPARRKFLKSTATEQRHIIDVVSRYALAYPEKRFSLSMNGRTVLNLREGSTLQERVLDIWGKSVREKLHLVSDERPSLSVHGILASPEVSRPGRSGIYTYVNKRSVMDPTLRTAVLEGYRGLLMKHRYPLAILFLDLDPAEIDVNVHPAKAEVRFKNASAVFGMVVSCVRKALSVQAQAPGPHLVARPREESSAYRVEENMAPYQVPAPGGEPQAAAAPHPEGAAGGGFHGRSYRGRVPEPCASQPHPDPEPRPAVQEDLFEFRSPCLRYADKAFVGVSHNTYILLQDESSLYILDQHAAHERVTFERLRNSESVAPEPRQTLLSPLVIELSPAEFRAYEEMAGDIAISGIETEPFGNAAIAVRAYPSILEGKDLKGIILDLLGAFMEGDFRKKDHRHDVLARIACHGSVRAGRRLGREEVLRLLKDLDEVGSPATCPHGRPLFKHIGRDEIERWIGRRPLS